MVLATDDAGAVVGRYEYSAFGMPLSATGAYTPRFGFSSKERDASGLVYYGFRFYSPELCRWITPDPIREDGGVNLYGFCGNNSIMFVDINGFVHISVYDGDDNSHHANGIDFWQAATRNSGCFTYDMGHDKDLKGLINYLKKVKAWGFEIDSISIFDHGYVGGSGQEYNNENILLLPNALSDMRAIGAMMKKTGEINMMGCYVGENSDVLQAYANSFNRRVTGSRAAATFYLWNKLLNWYRPLATVRGRNPQK